MKVTPFGFSIAVATSWFTVLILFSIADAGYGTLDEECCIFRPVQDGCKETLRSVQGHDGAMQCTLQTYQPQLSGGGTPETPPSLEGDRVRSWSHQIDNVSLVAALPFTDLQCQLFNKLDRHCMEYNQSYFIALNISFTLSGWNFDAILFNLTMLDGQDDPPFRTTRESYHYLIVDGSLGGEAAADNATQEAFFEYSGYVGLHPGSRYLVRAATLPLHPTEPVYSEMEVEVPNCLQLPTSKMDFFCNLPSPANWGSTIIVQPDTMDVEFSIWPDINVFDTYRLYLIEGDKADSTNVIETEALYVDDIENLQTMTIDGKEETFMHHHFDLSRPGTYTIAVLPRPDASCEADSHWGNEMCLYNSKVVFYSGTAQRIPPRPPPNIPYSTIAVSSTSSTSITEVSSHTRKEPDSSRTAPPDEFFAHETPMLMIIFIVLVLVLILIIFAIFIMCSSSETFSNWAPFHVVKECLICDRCFQDSVLDDWTVVQQDMIFVPKELSPRNLCQDQNLRDCIREEEVAPCL